MKLIRFGKTDAEKPGIIIFRKMFGLLDFMPDYDEHFFASDVFNITKIVEKYKG